MKLTDYIVKFFEERGLKNVFMLSGGGCMHLINSFGSSDKITYWCLHHEQSVSMATEAYARMKNDLGVAVVTCGPGSTNTITGVLGAYQDSVPCVFISGQAKRKNTVRLSGIDGLRQFGQQEVDIIPIVKPITKYAVMIDKPEDIRYHLEKACYLATNGRPGPVWIDVPLDVQNSQVDEASLRGFEPEEKIKKDISGDVAEVVKMLQSAQRPVIVAGHGVRIAQACDALQQLVERYDIPVVNSFLGVDVLPSEHKCNIGRIGIKGTRAGNFAMQNADLLLVIGSRLSVSSIGFEADLFAREAKKVIVDIDEVEHKKPLVKYDKLIISDAKDFLLELSQQTETSTLQPFAQWIAKTNDWKQRFTVFSPAYEDDSNGLNYYKFIELLNEYTTEKNPVISDAGSAFYVTSQAINLKHNQRYIPSGALATMGYTLPATVGVAVADLNNVTVGVTGDGSFMQNMQELSVLQFHQLPVKLFVVNNEGYLSIRQSENKFFAGHLVAEGPTSKVPFPNLRKVVEAFELPYYKIDSIAAARELMPKIFADNKPAVIEVISLPLQEIIPTSQSMIREDGTIVSKPLEDMYPYLLREEFNQEMQIKPL